MEIKLYFNFSIAFFNKWVTILSDTSIPQRNYGLFRGYLMPVCQQNRLTLKDIVIKLGVPNCTEIELLDNHFDNQINGNVAEYDSKTIKDGIHDKPRGIALE